jgi:hypothetical protein
MGSWQPGFLNADEIGTLLSRRHPNTRQDLWISNPIFTHIFGWAPGGFLGRTPSAPTGRANQAQANGLGHEVRPRWGFQALKGRNKGHPPAAGGHPRASPPCCFALSGLPTKNGAGS